MKENNNISLNVGFLDLLTLTFIILKLCDVIDWSWFVSLFYMYENYKHLKRDIKFFKGKLEERETKIKVE